MSMILAVSHNPSLAELQVFKATCAEICSSLAHVRSHGPGDLHVSFLLLRSGGAVTVLINQIRRYGALEHSRSCVLFLCVCDSGCVHCFLAAGFWWNWAMKRSPLSWRMALRSTARSQVSLPSLCFNAVQLSRLWVNFDSVERKYLSWMLFVLWMIWWMCDLIIFCFLRCGCEYEHSPESSEDDSEKQRAHPARVAEHPRQQHPLLHPARQPSPRHLAGGHRAQNQIEEERSG